MVPLFCTGHYRNRLDKYIHHYEGLSYDTELVHSKHQRAKRALSHEDKFLHLEFHAHGRFVNFYQILSSREILLVSVSSIIHLFIYLCVYLQSLSYIYTSFMIKGG